MKDLKLCESDYRFMLLVWEAEPLPSGKLVELCWERLGWKKSTTYTVLRKLCERGFVRNENTVVSACIPKEKVQVYQSGAFCRACLRGIPAWLSHRISGRQAVSEQEARELKELIDQHTRKGGGTS